ncbi:MAG: radical SAM protein [Desulfovibrionaceae bacterium]
MNVLLVYPNIHGMNMLPSSMGIFTALLKEHGHTVAMFDTTNWIIPGEEFDSDKEKERMLTARPFDDSKLWSDTRTSDVVESFAEVVSDFSPGLVAFSVTEDLFPVARLLLRHPVLQQIPTIIGGVFATFAPEKCLAEPSVDMVCIGEGEELLVELCSRLESGKPYTDIHGLWSRQEGHIQRNQPGPPVDFSKNPRIDLSLFDESRLYRPMQGTVWRMLPVETHRGCPYQCTYCNSPAQQKFYYKNTGRPYYRKKDFNAIHDELLYYKDILKAEALYFWADTFLSYTNKEFDQFCDIYQDIALPFWCQSRPETIREDRISKLMELGLFRMGLGVEHGDERFRKQILRRNVSNKMIVDNLAVLNSLGLKYSVNNIIGFPTETRELAFQTIELNRRIHPDSANAYSFSPFHGTRMRELAEDLGYCPPDLIARSAMKPTLLNMPHFPPHAIEGLRRCFTFYVRMPKSRWKDIERAEALTSEGDEAWEQLRNECLEHYIDLQQ